MTFNSLTFVVFFGIVLLLHSMPFSWRARKRNLLVASYLFYAAWNPPFVILVWISTVVDRVAAQRMHRTDSEPRRRLLLLMSVVVNLGLLGYFKYGGFLLENFVALMNLLGVVWEPAAPSIILPVGISFYTFQTMSYTLDVYRRKSEPAGDFLDFALFVTFFPQLVAGPIVRARSLLPQFEEPKRASSAQLGWGLALITIGLFEKIVLADGFLAPVVDTVHANLGQAGTVDLWVASMSFAGQIFFDFSGYSLCGIGTALCLGFVLPDNFRFPFACVGFADFWRRWHITLSSWMRDYVFIPLARVIDVPGRAAIAGFLTMAIVGLWHGAAWGFVLWGCSNGILMIAERLFANATGKGSWKDTSWARAVGNVVTMGFLVLFLPLFRAPNGLDGVRVVRDMLIGAPNELELGSFNAAIGLGTLPVLMAAHGWFKHRTLEEAWDRIPAWGRCALLVGMLVGIALAPTNDRAFIYFQF